MLLWSRALGPFGTNCYIIACPETRVAAVVDPGQPDPWIRQVVAKEQLQVEQVLLTHAHVDHIGGVEWVRGWAGVPVALHPDDLPMAADPFYNGSAMFGEPIAITAVERELRDGATVAVGNLRLQVLHTPGHTPGGVSLYTPGYLLAGDTLFAGSVGRADLPGGDYATLIRSIRTKLFALPAATVVYPGHGPRTTIGDERDYNPYAGGAAQVEPDG